MAETFAKAENAELITAESLFQKNQLEEAESICQKLLAESERNIRAMILMARIMLKRYRPDDGVQYLEKAIQADPKYLLAYKLLADVHYSRGDLAKAVDQYKKILEIDPMDIDAHNKVQDISGKLPPSPAPPQVQEVPPKAEPEPVASPLPSAPAAPAEAVPPTPLSVPVVQPPDERVSVKPPLGTEAEFIKARIISMAPKMKTVIEKNLSEIREISGVLGSILINKEGLTIGSSAVSGAELDMELVGALSLSIYKATNNAAASLAQGSLNQITLQTKEQLLTIFNSEEFILTTVMQKNANLGLVRLENGRCIKRIMEQFEKVKE